MLARVELMASDSERNAGFTPLHQPLLALSASKQSPDLEKALAALPNGLNP